jgi:hypothetical protein
LDALRPDIAGVALLARHASRALNTLRSRGPRNALDALRASLARRASCTTLARFALRPRRAGDTLRACWTSWADGTGSALLPSCTRRPDAT